MLLIEFKDFVSLEELSDLRIIFEGIPNKIEGVTNVEWGLNNSPENLNKNYMVVLTLHETFFERYIAEKL